MSTAEFFQALLQRFATQPPHPLRQKAWDHFLKHGLPTKSSPSFRYVPLHQLYNFAFSSSPIKTPTDVVSNALVFVEGSFIPELSQIPPQLTIFPLQEALTIYGPFLRGRIGEQIKEETDPFSLMNMALEQGGVFGYLPPNVKLEKPLHLIFYGQNYSPSRLHFFCSSNSELKTVTTLIGEGLHHISLDGALEKGALWSHIEPSSQASGICLTDFKATLKESSRLFHLAIHENSSLSRHRLFISLIEENSDALLQGLWNLHASQSCHTNIHVEHVAPSCRSLQKYKGVLHDQSQSSFQGKIYIHPQAQKTEAYQLNHNLIRGNGAIANTEPGLEIFADDVKASHGATVAQVNEEELFYLRTRGLSENSAYELLIQGFIQEIYNQIPHDFSFST